MQKIIRQIAGEIAASDQQVAATVALLDDGASVPFIARYRKERTGGLDDAQLRRLEERLVYLRELENRRQTVLDSIASQGKLNASLQRDILAAETKTRLEDLYLPYRPKRRSKAQIAREAGLEPLAMTLLQRPDRDPETAAADYVDADRQVPDGKAALEGARYILMEHFSEDAELVGQLRQYLWQHGILRSTLVAGKEGKAEKFADYHDYAEPISKIPSHRALALFRGRGEGLLQLELQVDQDAAGMTPSETAIARRFGIADKGRAADEWLQQCVRWAWKVKIFTHLDLELKMRLRESAEQEAIRVFGNNLKDLLLAPPAGNLHIMGLDPGLRTGVKVAVVDTTGQVVDSCTIYPHAPKKRWEESIRTLHALAARYGVDLIGIGNGTASRETDRLVAALIKSHPELKLRKVSVSEAGASVYSASELASAELPEMDVSLRGAVSIARRLQDPLAELVKIEPKSIGVGQYQHDVNQTRLAHALDKVVEDCVHSVGVDVNTASPALLGKISGLSAALAGNIVNFRNEKGAFRNRKQLLQVPRLGAKSFQQAAGFLRINGGDNPLDASAVHPEAYPVVQRIVSAASKGVQQIIGDRRFLQSVNAADYIDEEFEDTYEAEPATATTEEIDAALAEIEAMDEDAPGDDEAYADEGFGLPTVTDIISEREKPGRDPRGGFETASFQEGVEDISDLRNGMVLEGVVTNVTNFGAFVDVGVHQDGLVHISAMSEQYVKDPRDLVKAGDLVKVKVMDIDLARRRIALSMRLSDDVGVPRESKNSAQKKPSQADQQEGGKRAVGAQPQGSMAQALASALGKR